MTIVSCTVTGHVCPIIDIDTTAKHYGDTVQLDSDVTNIQALIEGGHITVP